MSAYRVTIPMIASAAFPVTRRNVQVPTYYAGDVITGADPQDIERLLVHGWIEPVDQPQEAVVQ